MRPASWRAVIWRWRPSTSTGRRSRGMIAICAPSRTIDDDPEQPVLQHDEDDGRQRLAAEEHRLHEGVADEAAERLDLVLDHGGELGLLDLAEMGRRKAQDTVVELVAQAAQHALAHAALLGVDRLLEEAVHDHGAQEDEAHGHQVAAAGRPGSRRRSGSTLPGRMADRSSSQTRNGMVLAVLERVALDAVVDDRPSARSATGSRRPGPAPRAPRMTTCSGLLCRQM